MDRSEHFRDRWRRRFSCAFRGLWDMLANEPSGRVHGVALVLVGVSGVWLRLAPLEWAVLAVAAGGVLAAEALNTAIEKLADRVSRDREEPIRRIKDLAAGGVLAAVLGAVLAGLAVLGPKFRGLLFGG